MRWNVAIGIGLAGMIALSGSGFALLETIGAEAGTAQAGGDAALGVGASAATSARAQAAALSPPLGDAAGSASGMALSDGSDALHGRACDATFGEAQLACQGAMAQERAIGAVGMSFLSFVDASATAAAALGGSIASSLQTSADDAAALELAAVATSAHDGVRAADAAATCMYDEQRVTGALCAQAPLVAYGNELAGL
jgi:hypothetical protein